MGRDSTTQLILGCNNIILKGHLSVLFPKDAILSKTDIALICKKQRAEPPVMKARSELDTPLTGGDHEQQIN